MEARKKIKLTVRAFFEAQEFNLETANQLNCRENSRKSHENSHPVVWEK